MLNGKNIVFLKVTIPNFIKYNYHYIAKLIFLIRSKDLSDKEIKKYQLSQINSNVKKFFNNRELEAINILVVNDLAKLHITSKSDYQSLISYKSTSKYNTYKTNTGGTTGTPLTMYKSRKDLAKEAAFIDYYLLQERVNIFVPYKAVRLRGDKVNGILCKTGVNKYSLSSYNINSKTCLNYFNFLNAFKPDVIFAYPSSLYLLCKELLAAGVKEKLKAKLIVCSSECLFDYQHKLIKQFFNAKVINLFGNTEHTVLAVNYMDGNGFKINPFYSFVEFIEGKLVTTSFNDENMPFLRYDTGDLVNIDCEGGVELVGRSQDIAVGLSGQHYPLVGIIFGQHFELFNYIKEMQLIQTEKGKITFSYFSANAVPATVLESTLQIIKKATENDLIVTFDWQLSKLQRTKAGKLKFFTSNI